MLRPNSIIFRLLTLIVGAFLVSTVSILFMANKQLSRIVDKSQESVLSEKVETIYEILSRSDERLKKTGMVEAYLEDFQNTTLKSLRQSYYKHSSPRIYPFILNTDGIIVMHPVLAPGDESVVDSDIVRQLLAASQGGFGYTYLGEEKWCYFKQFPEWNWVVGYTVPLEIKYADVREFRNALMAIMGGITIVVLLILSLVVRRFSRPITRLTNAAVAMAAGNLDQEVEIGGKDEVGTLARSFSHMRDSIRQTISELKKENAERRKVEENLVLQNEYINNILESVTHPLYAIDVNDYTVKIANSASGFKTGTTSTCYALTHQQDSPCHEADHPCPLEIIKKTHKPTMVKHVHYDGEGNKRDIEVYAYPVFDRQGELVQMIEYGIDVTERTQAKSDLAAEKERLSVTLRSIGDGVITTDTAGEIVMLNKVAEDLTGWSNHEAVGRALSEVFRIVNEQSRAACDDPIAKVISSGQITGLNNNTVLLARDGTERIIADSGAPILDADSEIIGVVLVFRDVSEQVKTEKELLKVKKLESVGILAGGIAHDFNNILAAILGNINLALFDKELQENTRQLLAAAEKASLRAKDLTQQLLTFAKGGEPVTETSSLENVVKDSANFVLHGDKVACRYHMPDDLWLVDIDKGQVSQVIQNIVLNAGHAMPDGGIIEISCDNLPSVSGVMPLAGDGKFVRISIKDNGIGMAANVADKIFDPYFTTKHDGSGLGLAISQSIIHKHNGHIAVESTPGVGSTFLIYLPATGDQRQERHEALPVTDSLAKQQRIMIMDDEEMVRDVAGAMLAQLGHEVVFAAHGAEAVGIYQGSIETGQKIDLVIMDLTIPGGMGGEEAVQEIIKLDSAAKVIVSSGYSNDPIMANFKDNGFCAAIVKPYQMQELSKTVNAVIS